jgi:hypothetical protein
MLPDPPRPRAADDFAAIRARMEELRREREQLAAESKPNPVSSRRPYAGISLAIRRSWMGNGG